MVHFNVMFIDYVEGTSERDIKGMRCKAKLLAKTLEGLYSVENIYIQENKKQGHEYFILEFDAQDKFIKKVFECCKNTEAYVVRTRWCIDERN